MSTKSHKKFLKQENRLTQLKKHFDIATLFHIGFTLLVYAAYLSMMMQLVYEPSPLPTTSSNKQAQPHKERQARQEATEWIDYNIDAMLCMWLFHMMARLYYFRQRHASVAFVALEWSELFCVSVLALLQRFDGAGGLAAAHHLKFPAVSVWLLLSDVLAVLGIIESFVYSGYAYFKVIQPLRKATEEESSDKKKVD